MLSLRCTKLIFVLIIIVLASALVYAGGLIEGIVAAILLFGALPLFNRTAIAAADETLNEIERRAIRPKRFASAEEHQDCADVRRVTPR